MMISLLLHQSKFISFLFLFFLFLIKTLNAQPTHLDSYCNNSGDYRTDSWYKYNLDYVLSFLHSQSTKQGFYDYSWRSGSSSTPRVYGTYLCRGDVSSLTCETCISSAWRRVLTACPFQKEAIIWYEECLLRYSDRQMYSIFDDGGPFFRQTTSNTMSHDLAKTVEDRIDRLRLLAYWNSSFFAEETHQVSYFGVDYDLDGLVQCTPDLDPDDCYRCLIWAYNETVDCCYGKRFALFYSTNCMLTYNVLVSPPPPPPPAPSDDSFSFNFKGKVFRKIIAPVIAAVVVILAICVCSLCCCFKKKKEEVEEREIPTTNVAESPTVDQPIAKTESQSPN